MSRRPPTHDDIVSRWQAVAGGAMTREAACRWAESIRHEDFDPALDSFLGRALELFTQFDLTYRSRDPLELGHGPPGDYVRTNDAIARSLVTWVENAEGYAADPEAWTEAHRAEPC